MSATLQGTICYAHGTRNVVSRVFMIEMEPTGVNPELLKQAIGTTVGLAVDHNTEGWVYTICAARPVQVLLRLDEDSFRDAEMSYAESCAMAAKLAAAALNELLREHGCGGLTMKMAVQSYPDGSGEPADDSPEPAGVESKKIRVAV